MIALDLIITYYHVPFCCIVVLIISDNAIQYSHEFMRFGRKSHKFSDAEVPCNEADYN